jgi:hypothetical protein
MKKNRRLSMKFKSSKVMGADLAWTRGDKMQGSHDLIAYPYRDYPETLPG